MSDAGAIVFLVFLFVLVLALMYVYTNLKTGAWACLNDPGGRKEYKKKKKKKGFRNVSPDESSDEGYLSPSPVKKHQEARFATPTAVRAYPQAKFAVPIGVRAFSAYGDVGAMDHASLPGRVRFDVGYSRDQFYLKIHVIDCDRLPEHGINYRIQVTLLPKKEQQFTTKTASSSTTPKFNETFVFKNILQANLPKSIIQFQLLGDFEGSTGTFGEAFFQLACFVKMKSPVFQGIWRSFQPVK